MLIGFGYVAVRLFRSIDIHEGKGSLFRNGQPR